MHVPMVTQSKHAYPALCWILPPRIHAIHTDIHFWHVPRDNTTEIQFFGHVHNGNIWASCPVFMRVKNGVVQVSRVPIAGNDDVLRKLLLASTPNHA